MALAYSSAIQSQIALRTFGQSYANLTTEDKAAIDDTWSSGTPGGLAGDALTKINQYANFVQGVGDDEAPDEWKAWLIWEVVYDHAITRQGANPDIVSDFRRRRDDAMRTALSTYSYIDADDTSATDGLAVTHLNIRRFVLNACVKQQRMILPDPKQIDAKIREAVYSVWERSDWGWRRYRDTVTIASGAGVAPTVTYGTGNEPDGVASRYLYYVSSDDSKKGDEIRWASADEMARLHALSLTAGRPQFFRTVKQASDDTLVWYLDRDTDTEYVLRGEFLSACPKLNTGANLATALAAMPDNFLDAVRNLVLAEVLTQHGSLNGYRLKSEVNEDLAELAEKDDAGKPAEDDAFNKSKAAMLDLMNGQDHDYPILGGSM